MKTINCRIKLHEFADISGLGITPAEAVVLQTLHGANAGGAGKVIMNPVAAGEVKRSDVEEVNRLMGKYPVRGKSEQPIVKELFPGALPKLPASFAEIGIENVAEPAKGKKTPAETPTE